MSKRTLNDHIATLRRTLQNASDRAIAAEQEAEDLRRENAILQRRVHATSRHDAAVTSEFVAIAKDACADLVETRVEQVRALLATTADALRQHMDSIGEAQSAAQTRLLEVPVSSPIGDDALTAEIAKTSTELKRTRTRIRSLQQEVLQAREEAAAERNLLVAEREDAIRRLREDRAALHAQRELVAKIARRLPSNWRAMLTPEALAATMFKSAPNLAYVAMIDLLEMFWAEFGRMDAERQELDKAKALKAEAAGAKVLIGEPEVGTPVAESAP